jgi:hypothetical protein
MNLPIKHNGYSRSYTQPGACCSGMPELRFPAERQLKHLLSSQLKTVGFHVSLLELFPKIILSNKFEQNPKIFSFQF